jgi:hypothetical protein
MVTGRAGKTVRVTGPNGETVDVKFFADGSIRYRLNEAGPMVTRYAFLSGKGQNVIVELKPM